MSTRIIGGIVESLRHPTHAIIRSHRCGRFPLAICLLVFLSTAAIVCRLGYEQWSPVGHGPRYTATAHVSGQGAKQNGQRLAASGQRVQDVSQTSTINNQQPTTRQHTNPLPRGVETVAFAQSGDDSSRAAELANAQADRYVSSRRAEWQKSWGETHRQAHAQTEIARRTNAAAEARLKTFDDQMRVAEAAAAARAAAPAKSRPPAMIDNPRKAELQRQLADLRQRRERLLVDRTPSHPAVQAADEKIADIEQELAAVPQRVSNPEAGGASADNPTAEAARQWMTALAAQKNRQRHAELAAAADKTRRALTGAELAEQRAQRHLQAGPCYEIQYAKIVENPMPIDYGWWRILWTSLALGIVTAVGAGLVLQRCNIDLPITTVEEVEAALGIPVVGVVPADFS
jgi:hypothetical protein